MLIRTVGPFNFVKSGEGYEVYACCDNWKYRTLYICAEDLQRHFPNVMKDKPLKIEVYDKPGNDRIKMKKALKGISMFNIGSYGYLTRVWHVIERYCKRNLPKTFYVRVIQ